MMDSLPGTPEHQQILQTVIDHYASDDSILAVIVFGSLGAGNWDAYSDLDLDIVTRDDVAVNVAKELSRLCAVIKGDYGLDSIIIPDEDEGDVVLSNLLELSIRYHPLHDTKPAILDTMLVLSGELSAEDIREAGEGNRLIDQPKNLRTIVNQCIRYALEIQNAVKRGRIWLALELLHRIRLLLMELFTISQDGIRPVQHFEAYADPQLHDYLKQISAQPDLTSINAAVGEALNILENHLDVFSAGQYQLTEQQQAVLGQIKGQR